MQSRKIDTPTDPSAAQAELNQLQRDLLAGVALEMICIVPMANGEIKRIRFFVDEIGSLQRSLL